MNSGQEALSQKRQAREPEQDRPPASMHELACMTMAEMSTLLRFSPDALIVIDAQGTIVRVNEQALILFGYSSSELEMQPLEILLPQRFHAAHLAHRTRYLTAPHSRPMGADLDLVGQRKDRREFPVDISLRPVLLEQTLHILAAIRDVSVQRRLEWERRHQLEQLALQGTLINLAHDAILVRDPASRVISWNQGAEHLYGWTEKEALGRVSHTLLHTRFPSSPASVQEQLEREQEWEGELVHTRRDGRTLVVESRQVLIRDRQGAPKAILEINRDVTERRHAQEVQMAAQTGLLSQHTFLHLLLDFLPSGISVVHGPQARLLLTNQAAARIWGASWPLEQPMQAFLQEQGIELVDPAGRPLAREQWATTRALLHGETVLQYQEVIRQPEGTMLPILVSAVPLSSPHWRSISELDQPESPDATVPSHGELLALMIHQDVRLLKEAEYLKDEFIGIAAHELRQPLAVLKGTVGTLVRQTARGHGPALASWQQEMLQDLDEATERLVHFVDELLDVTRLQAGQMLLHVMPTDLVALGRRLVQRVQQTTTLHEIRFHAEQPEVRATVDPHRIEQVLSNLLTNAIKYSPQGGVVQVVLTTQEGGQQGEIQVRDCGIGIPEHQQARIFGRFMRADNAHAAGIRGTGLGLYLCHGLIAQHGGRIWFESEEGKGTTFFVRLPLSTPVEL